MKLQKGKVVKIEGTKVFSLDGLRSCEIGLKILTGFAAFGSKLEDASTVNIAIPSVKECFNVIENSILLDEIHKKLSKDLLWINDNAFSISWAQFKKIYPITKMDLINLFEIESCDSTSPILNAYVAEYKAFPASLKDLKAFAKDRLSKASGTLNVNQLVESEVGSQLATFIKKSSNNFKLGNMRNYKIVVPKSSKMSDLVKNLSDQKAKLVIESLFGATPRKPLLAALKNKKVSELEIDSSKSKKEGYNSFSEVFTSKVLDCYGLSYQHDKRVETNPHMSYDFYLDKKSVHIEITNWKGGKYYSKNLEKKKDISENIEQIPMLMFELTGDSFEDMYFNLTSFLKESNIIQGIMPFEKFLSYLLENRTKIKRTL